MAGYSFEKVIIKKNIEFSPFKENISWLDICTDVDAEVPMQTV